MTARGRALDWTTLVTWQFDLEHNKCKHATAEWQQVGNNKHFTFVALQAKLCPSCVAYVRNDRAPHKAPRPVFVTDLLVVLLLGLEVVVNGLEPQVDVREIVQPVSPPGRDVVPPRRRHPCPEKKFGLCL